MAAAVAAHQLRVNRIHLVADSQQRPDQPARSRSRSRPPPAPGPAHGRPPAHAAPPTPASPSAMRLAASMVPSWSSRHRSWWRSPQSTPTNSIAILLRCDLLSVSQRRTCGALRQCSLARHPTSRPSSPNTGRDTLPRELAGSLSSKCSPTGSSAVASPIRGSCGPIRDLPPVPCGCQKVGRGC
jgi:hypothetical protein